MAAAAEAEGDSAATAAFDAVVGQITAAMRRTASHPEFAALKSCLVGDMDVIDAVDAAINDSTVAGEADVSRLRLEVLHIKGLIRGAATTFSLSCKDVLSAAIDRHRHAMAMAVTATQGNTNTTAMATAAAGTAQLADSLADIDCLGSPLTPSSSHPPLHASLSSPALLPSMASSSSSAASASEHRQLRSGRAILRLKRYRQALKYACWDFQDGKNLSEAAATHRLDMGVLEHTIGFVLKRTGETLDQFRTNRAADFDRNPDAASDADYKDKLRQAVVAFKDKQCTSLHTYAVQHGLGIFDLIDAMVREIEIESRLSALTPVPVEQAAAVRTEPMPVLHNLDSFAADRDDDDDIDAMQHTDDDMCVAPDALSDLEEVIRDERIADTLSASVTVISDEDRQPAFTIMVNVCPVCSKLFFDAQSFHDHMEHGCIDYN